jgi:hypothetical protein
MSMAIVCYGTVYQRTINTNNIYLLTMLSTISAIIRLVQKYETLPVLPKQLTETQEKVHFFRGGWS